MSARDDYPITTVWSRDKLGQVIDMHHAMCDEIDRLRAEVTKWQKLYHGIESDDELA